MSKVKLSALQDISSSAAEVLLAIAGKHDDVSKNDSTEMCRLWDNLNDHFAPPAVVKSMADELINLRKHNQMLRAQRIADRRRFSSLVPNELLSLVVRSKPMNSNQPPALTVWYGSMPESNGKSNWTAILHRQGECISTGITVDRSEYPDRVRYEADRMRHLIGELQEEPDILAYDANKHSGYEPPATVQPVSQRYKLPDLNEELIKILGRPNFRCAWAASILRKGGMAINRKAEDEQAAVIHFLLGHYLQSGDKWFESADKSLSEIAAAPEPE